MLLRRLSRWWLGSVFVIFSVILLYNVLYYRFTGLVPNPLVNVDEEWNVPTIFSAGVFASLFFPLVQAMVRLKKKGNGLQASLYGVIGVLILFLVADELFQFHDGLLRGFFFDYCDAVRICFNGAEWVWFYLPLLLVVGASILYGLKKSGFQKEHNHLFLMSMIIFFSVFILEWIEPALAPYGNYVQEWIEIVGALLLYMHCETEAGWQKH